jgi:hypothetical protein
MGRESTQVGAGLAPNLASPERRTSRQPWRNADSCRAFTSQQKQRIRDRGAPHQNHGRHHPRRERSQRVRESRAGICVEMTRVRRTRRAQLYGAGMRHLRRLDDWTTAELRGLFRLADAYGAGSGPGVNGCAALFFPQSNLAARYSHGQLCCSATGAQLTSVARQRWPSSSIKPIPTE